jgi:hypothetical protein
VICGHKVGFGKALKRRRGLGAKEGTYGNEILLSFNCSTEV